MIEYLQKHRVLTALALLSAFALMMMAVRIAWTGQITFVFLVWNLILAWVPVGLSLLLPKAHRLGILALLPLLGTWLLFFPNAPYIITDFVHLKARAGTPFWYDLILISSFALAGLLCGWISLLQVHKFLSLRLRPAYAWIMVTLASFGAGWGIYLGRVLRWNSWDILREPRDLAHDLAAPFLHPMQNLNMIVISLVFGGFLFAGYLTLRWMAMGLKEN